MSDNDKNGSEFNEEMDHDQITLTLDDGSELICDVIAIFPYNNKEYIALLPTDAEEDGEVFLYQFVQKDNDEIDLIDIENDEEFDEVADAFDEYLDSNLYDEMADDEDEEEE